MLTSGGAELIMTSDFSIAVHALVFLNHKAATQTSDQLAENICTHSVRVRKIMAKLKKSELICTREGADGGYLFCKTADEVSLYDVSRSLGEEFVSSSWRSGDEEMHCPIASSMADIMGGIYLEMDNQCKEYLEKITIADLDKQIFGK